MLNGRGRPLEFHCTAPIKPNRAQQILYGPTLEPYLYGEQIGSTLISKAKARPLVVCTDCVPALAVRDHVEIPVLLVLADEGAGGPPALLRFRLGHNDVAVLDGADEDRRLATERIATAAESLDLREPFQRIREAIEEAQRAVRKSA